MHTIRTSVDESKICDGLGPGFPLPVEITPFCHEHTLRTIAALPSCAGSEAILRMGSSSSNVNDGDEIAVTDNGNYIVDLHFTEPIKDAPAMATELKNTVGVVEHGLFCDMTTAGKLISTNHIVSLHITYSYLIQTFYFNHPKLSLLAQMVFLLKNKCNNNLREKK